MDIEKKSIAKALSVAWFDAIALAAKSVGGERATALELAKSHSATIAQLTDAVAAEPAQTPQPREVAPWKPERSNFSICA